MKFLDLLRMSTSSLWKRKVRTILTVLGVVIGTASIVVMMSLGIGLNESNMAMIENAGGLTTITVNQSYGGGEVYGFKGTSEGGSDTEVKYLDDELVSIIENMEHVEFVAPSLRTSVVAKYGSYENNMSVVGLPSEILEKKKFNLEYGGLPKVDDGVLDFLYGDQVLSGFNNPKSYDYSGGGINIDVTKEPVFMIFDTDAYYQSQWNDGSSQPVKPPKKYPLYGSGLIAGVEDVYNDNSWSVYCDIEELKTVLKKEFKNRVIPGQPTMKSGKPYKELFYSQLEVNVTDLKYMYDIQEDIIEMGYEAWSNAEWIEQQKEQTGLLQAVLGGIGAVSLLVAAIGITNTMMMSIYERTKEIGIIKVLGCDMKNIREQFLLESGYIGLIGGVAGIIFSYIISFVINKLVATSGNMMGMGMMVSTTTKISVIPIWLAASAVVFAVVVGMLAGFFPALRAMKLSPLAAIKNE